MQPLQAAVLQAADDLPFNVRAAKDAIEDSDLPPAKAAECTAAIDAKAKELQQRYDQIKQGANASPEEANSMMPLFQVLRSQVPDQATCQAIAMQIALEMQLSSLGTITPLNATSALRKYVALAMPTDEQQKQIDPILGALQEAIDKELKGRTLDKNVAADRAEAEQIQKRLTPVSRKSWNDIRNVLTKDQRRSLVAKMSKRG